AGNTALNAADGILHAALESGFGSYFLWRFHRRGIHVDVHGLGRLWYRRLRRRRGRGRRRRRRRGGGGRGHHGRRRRQHVGRHQRNDDQGQQDPGVHRNRKRNRVPLSGTYLD